jgi:subtilisin family serine protease
VGAGKPGLIALVVLLLGAAPAQAACDPAPANTYTPGGAPHKGGPVDDPLFGQQWGLLQIKVPAAWERGFRGRGTVIAILDSGIDQTHPDLLPNMLPGADMLARWRGGADCPPGPEDDDGHGTHTAGIAAAAANNGIGIAGVAPEAKILPLKAGDKSDIPLEAMNDGIRYAADQGADVISISLARGESPLIPGTQIAPLEPQTEEAVEYAWSRGTVVVGAAGNGSLPLCSYPGGASKAVCVTASGSDGMPTSYSNNNAGAEADGTVVVRAPGGGGAPGTVESCVDNVVATMWPRGEYDSCLKPKGVKGYEHLAGTSMSAPHVAGLAALLAGAGLSAPEIVARIKDTAALPFDIVDADAATDGLPTPAPPLPPIAPAPAPGSAPPAGGAPAPSAADRRCTQARATLKLRDRALRSARRKFKRRHTKANRRLVTRRLDARRVAARDVRRRC